MKQGGVHELLNAEEKASAIIAGARSARTERMKEAKREAEARINKFRGECEANYQAAMQKTMGSTGSDGATLAQETDKAISGMKADYDKNKQAVVDMLVNSSITVKCVVPEGRKIAQA